MSTTTCSGQTGPVVGTAPVRAHRPDAADGAWQYCPTAGCEVVFHLHGTRVTGRMVAARVGRKAVHAVTPVCFCFAHTRADLAADLVASGGAGTIKPAIKAAVADGLCACEHLNPAGRCCLPAVTATLKDLATAGVPAGQARS